MPLSKEKIKSHTDWYSEPARLVEFGRYFFPNAIRGMTPKVHYDLCNNLYSVKPVRYITFPRGRAKTTWVRIYIIHRILYNQIYDGTGKLIHLTRYIGYKSNTETKAKAYCAWILEQFEYNKNFIAHYGAMKDDKIWSPSKARFTNGVYLMPFGANQSMRGGLEGEWRYTDILWDDLDDLEEASSPTIMEKHWDKLDRDDMQGLDAEYGKARLLGTVINKDCCIQKAIDDAREDDSIWSGVIYRALDDNGRSIWETRFPTEKILADKKRALARGKYAGWLAEQMNMLMDEESRVFKKEWYKFYDGYLQTNEDGKLELVIEKLFTLIDGKRVDLDDNLPKIVPVNAFLGIDPAGEKSKGDSDFWVLFPLLIDPDNNRYVGDYIRERMTTIKFWEYLFDDGGMVDVYQFKRAKFESNAGFSALQSVTIAHMVKTGKIIPIMWVKNTEEKKQRITDTLEPPWSAGAVYIKRKHSRLMEEAENHPNIHHEDVLDGWQMAESIAKIRPQKPITPGIVRFGKKGKKITPESERQHRRSWAVI